MNEAIPPAANLFVIARESGRSSNHHPFCFDTGI
jgi:hypothetical protein